MVSKELLEKAKKCTSKEELTELLKSENINLNIEEINNFLETFNSNKELSDDELENVTGGTCYSSCTFADLGITPDCPVARIESWYHPVITTVGNACGLHPKKYNPPCACSECKYSVGIGVTLYCKARSREYDPAQSKI